MEWLRPAGHTRNRDLERLQELVKDRKYFYSQRTLARDKNRRLFTLYVMTLLLTVLILFALASVVLSTAFFNSLWNYAWRSTSSVSWASTTRMKD